MPQKPWEKYQTTTEGPWAKYAQTPTPEAAPEPQQPKKVESLMDLRFPGMISPNELGSLLGGMVGVPRGPVQAKVPPLKDMLLQQLNPLNNLQTGVGMLKGMGSMIVNAPSKLQSDDYYEKGEGLGGVLAAVPVAKMATSGIRAGLSGLRPQPATVPKLAAKINSWIDVNPRDMTHGANPGAQIVKEGLLGKTKEATKQNLARALADSGKEISTKLKAADTTGVKIDNTNAVVDALLKAESKYGTASDDAFQARLDGIFKKVVKEHPNLAKATPSETQNLAADLGKSISWTGAPYEGNINQVLVEMRGAISGNLKKNVPEIGASLRRWGNLTQGKEAIDYSIVKDLAGKGTGVKPPTRANELVKGLKKYGPRAALGTGLAYGGYRAVVD